MLSVVHTRGSTKLDAFSDRSTGTLLSATNGSHLWSGSFSGRQSDRVSLVNALAAQLARAVGQLSVGVHAASPDSEGTRMTVRA